MRWCSAGVVRSVRDPGNLPPSSNTYSPLWPGLPSPILPHSRGASVVRSASSPRTVSSTGSAARSAGDATHDSRKYCAFCMGSSIRFCCNRCPPTSRLTSGAPLTKGRQAPRSSLASTRSFPAKLFAAPHSNSSAQCAIDGAQVDEIADGARLPACRSPVEITLTLEVPPGPGLTLMDKASIRASAGALSGNNVRVCNSPASTRPVSAAEMRAAPLRLPR